MASSPESVGVFLLCTCHELYSRRLNEAKFGRGGRRYPCAVQSTPQRRESVLSRMSARHAWSGDGVDAADAATCRGGGAVAQA
jgi:hypothetical protein